MALLSGAYAAALTPRRDGEIDLGAMLEVIDFLIASKVDGLALFTAAGEPVHFTAEDRVKTFKLVSRRTRLPLVAGICASNWNDAEELVDGAVRANAAALLVAPPYFYRYRQSDLIDYYTALARESGGVPLLLYDIPEFAEPVAPGTVERLMAGGVIAGVAVSSDEAWLRDPADGVISPSACAVPELWTGRRMPARLGEFLERAAAFTFPAAIREALATRRVNGGPHPVAPSAETQARLAEFRDWFQAWLPEVQQEAGSARR